MNPRAALPTRIPGCFPKRNAAFLPCTSSHLWPMAIVAAVACCLAGCGTSKRPPLGVVEGTVTLDGVPLPGALVVFTPNGPGRSATAVTDTAGRYALTFLRDIAGANVGSHAVRITTTNGQRGRKEMLPARYHRKSHLVASVEPGHNTVDFPLALK